MPSNFNKWFSRISLGLAIITIVAVAVWFGCRVMTVEGDYSLDERIARAFGWGVIENSEDDPTIPNLEDETVKSDAPEIMASNFGSVTNAPTNNCTAKYGSLMLINSNFTVEPEFIATRGGELVDLTQSYGIQDIYQSSNLIDSEAGEHLNEMLLAYEADYPGHRMQTASCFQIEEVNCGEFCFPNGASDYHTGLSCNLVDPYYGTSLDSSLLEQHLDWKWLDDNAYKYGFIDRFPEARLGESLDSTAVIDEDGTGGPYRAWHYRYVGVDFATDIATGKYNDGQYDSLEHYLKARGLVTDLKTGKCTEKDV